MARKHPPGKFRYETLWKNNTILGFICGLIAGLFIAVMIAMIITRSPMPFNNGQARQEKNPLDVAMPVSDPNRPLYGDREAAREAYQKAQEAATDAPDNSPKSTSDTQTPTTFLQAGAYREKKDAEQMRAKLALLGIEANIKEVRSQGNPLYRVYLGPYSPRKLAAAQNKLRENGIDFVAVRSQ